MKKSKFVTIMPYNLKDHTTVVIFSDHPIGRSVISQGNEIAINVPDGYVNNVLCDYCCELERLSLKQSRGVWKDIDYPGNRKVTVYMHGSAYHKGGTITFLTGRTDDQLCKFLVTEEKKTETQKKSTPPNEDILCLSNDIKLELVLIPAGSFVMGSPKTEKERLDDETQHEVTISKAFYMGKYEVTQAQYEALMGDNPSDFKGARNPVEMVSWNDAQEFCKKLSQKTGRMVRLPTEAEWEYACRAGTRTPFNTGETISTEQANYEPVRDGVYRQETVAVGSFQPNGWGLYDMHGNVFEWCQDWYGEYSRGATTDPQGSAEGEWRVLRGGSWYFSPGFCRSADRGRHDPVYRSNSIGFRVVVAGL